MQVIPTILTTTTQEFEEQMKLFPQYFTRIQLDIADGKLVPNKTVQIEEMVQLFESGSLPEMGRVTFDLHLMVENYHAELKKIQELTEFVNVDAVLINVSLKPDLATLNELYPLFSIGLDINPEIQIEDVAQQYNLSTIPAIQIMSVNPGFQGSPFIPQVLEKFELLRNKNYRGLLFEDGGINDKTIPEIIAQQYKPDFLCVGSFLTKAGIELPNRMKYLEEKSLI